MSTQKPTGPAQPDKIDHAEGERSPTPSNDSQRETKGSKDDLPGADGPRSAGANEDTYD